MRTPLLKLAIGGPIQIFYLQATYACRTYCLAVCQTVIDQFPVRALVVWVWPRTYSTYTSLRIPPWSGINWLPNKSRSQQRQQQEQ